MKKQPKVSSPVGLFILLLREKGYTQVNSTTFIKQETGDRVVLEYIRGKAAMYFCEDSGLAHVIWYAECPLSQKTKDWLARQQAREYQPKSRPRRKGRPGRKPTAMQTALKGALKEARHHVSGNN